MQAAWREQSDSSRNRLQSAERLARVRHDVAGVQSVPAAKQASVLSSVSSKEHTWPVPVSQSSSATEALHKHGKARLDGSVRVVV